MRIAVDLIVGGRLAVRTPIGEGVMTLGASQSSDLCLPHEGVDPTHLVFHRRGTRLSCSNEAPRPFRSTVKKSPSRFDWPMAIR